MKNEGKNKSVVLIILFSVILQYKCTIIIIIIIITIIMIIIILAFGSIFGLTISSTHFHRKKINK